MVDGSDIKEIENTGVTLLDNCWREWNGMLIGGLTSGYVTDYRAFRSTQPAEPRYPHLEDLYGIGLVRIKHRPETEWLSSFADQPGYKVLLSHHPEYFPLIPASVDLVLSGHAHGGQIRLFNHGLWSSGQGWWPKWTRGVYDGRLVVSTGLSNTTWIPRIGNPTEIVYLEP